MTCWKYVLFQSMFVGCFSNIDLGWPVTYIGMLILFCFFFANFSQTFLKENESALHTPNSLLDNFMRTTRATTSCTTSYCPPNTESNRLDEKDRSGDSW